MKKFSLFIHVPTPSPRRRRGGFTLLEIMLVVMIISLLMGFAIYKMGGTVGVAKDVRTRGDIQTLSMQVRLYESVTGSLPSTEQGLQALMVQPQTEPKPQSWRRLMDDIPKDGWNQDYIYVQPGKHNTDSFDLYSKGEDHLPDTADDIGNWKK